MKKCDYMNLESTCESIITGLVLSRKKSIDNNGTKYKVLTLKSFNTNGYLDEEFLEDFYSEELLENKYFTKEGDIIVRLSYPNTAIYIDKEKEGLLVSSLFIILRNKRDIIYPEYLKFYLNSEQARRELEQHSIGSAVSIIKVSSFKEIKIPIYDFKYQEKVINISRLILEERKLLNKLIDEKIKYQNEIMKKIFK